MNRAEMMSPSSDSARQGQESEKSKKLLGWVLFDGSCGFCSRWVRKFERTLSKRGFAIAPLQSDWVQKELQIPADELLHDIRLRLADGSQVRGADAYRYVLRRIWWALPLYLFSVTPGLRHVFDWSYRTFANNRFRISRACRLSLEAEPQSQR